MKAFGRAVAVFLLAAAAASQSGRTARADTLELYDGRTLSGEVSRSGSGYVVKMKLGQQYVEESMVKRWVKGDAPRPSARSPVTPPPKPATVSPPAPGTPPKPDLRRALDALLKQGQDALDAKDYPAAKAAFMDAVNLDRANAKAQHGLALACMSLGDFQRARDPMEAAYAAANADRATVLNMATLQLGTTPKNPMRAAKVCFNYLQAHPEPPDEPVLNALAAALSQADAQARGQLLFKSAEQFYAQYNAKLEASRPGYKRWGVQWLPADDVDQKLGAWKAKQRELDRLEQDAAAAAEKAASASAALEKQQRLHAGGFVDRASVQEAQKYFDQADQRRRDKQEAYDALARQVERPVFPKALQLVAIDATTPPPLAGVAEPPAGTEVASAAGANAETSAAGPPRRTTAKGRKAVRVQRPRTAPAPAESDPAPLVVPAAPKAPKKVRITRYAAAFPVAPDLLVTAASAVEDATDLEVQTLEGNALKAELVRSDPDSGLALVRVTGQKLDPLPLADTFTGGAVQCAALSKVSIFAPAAEMIAGNLSKSAGEWAVKLGAHPRLAGAPLLSAGRVVGVELASRESEPDKVPVAPLEKLRSFLASDAAPPSAKAPDARTVMMQIVAAREGMSE